MVLVQDLCHTLALPWFQNFFLENFFLRKRERAAKWQGEREKRGMN